ncbi:MAG: 3-dehydroquinate synthase [Porticoccaceae bacterium]|nr:MAG: 3-dehydroquinate synthase [Porticoccaceae bacterium]
MRVVEVALGERSYPIYIGEGLLARADLFARHLPGPEVFVVSDERVAPLYLETLRTALPGRRLDTLVVPAGEAHKTLATVERIFDALLGAGHGRTTTLVALGGGVVGDLTGFAAACYQRGVRFLQVPTTLLAQVDSSVGGKTGVNHPLGKNMIGAFHQPAAVVADLATLATLPEREYRAGLAEVVKYGLIADAHFYRWLGERLEGLKGRDPGILEEVVARCCRIKAEVVARDEREAGLRAILNLGHTFGHAIEALQDYRGWLHGEAVAVGLVLAAELSARLGRIPKAAVEELEQLLAALGLPTRLPKGLAAEEMLAAMGRDKKVVAGSLRLVLLDGLGRAEVTDRYPRDLLADLLAEQCAAGADPASA